MEENNIIELEEDYIVLSIPVNTLEVSISAKVWHDGRVVEVSKVMDLDTVREMFKEAQNGYFPENAVFTLTDKGKAYLEELKRRQLVEMEEAE